MANEEHSSQEPDSFEEAEWEAWLLGQPPMTYAERAEARKCWFAW
jgi:hypothetical protein